MATGTIAIETAINGVEFGEHVVYLKDEAAAQVFYRFAYYPRVRITLEIISDDEQET